MNSDRFQHLVFVRKSHFYCPYVFSAAVPSAVPRRALGEITNQSMSLQQAAAAAAEKVLAKVDSLVYPKIVCLLQK